MIEQRLCFSLDTFSSYCAAIHLAHSFKFNLSECNYLHIAVQGAHVTVLLPFLMYVATVVSFTQLGLECYPNNPQECKQLHAAAPQISKFI